MNGARKTPGDGDLRRTFRRLLFLGLAFWTAACAGSMVYHLLHTKKYIEMIARETAEESITKDKLYRRWAAGHGSVYVPVTDATQPNPYLANVRERDITTPSGRRLTLMNPAYVTRQVHELGQSRSELWGHITSLNPLRPENAPDDWERNALRAIEAGAPQFGEAVEFRGAPHYRLMVPLPTEESCLKCHAAQGYKLGDLRGGISASIPLAVFDPLVRDHLLSEALHFGGIWVLGIACASLMVPFVRRRIEEKEKAEEELRRSGELTQSIIDNEPACVKLLGPDGSLQFMNRAGLAMIDAPGLEKVKGGMVADLVVPEHREAFVRMHDRVFTGEAGTLEFEMVGFKGSRRWLETSAVPLHDADGRVALHLGITRDVTERKRSEQALRESEEKFRALIESTSDWIWEIDADGVYTYASPAIRDILGYEPGEVLGRTPFDLMAPGEAARLAPEVAATIAARGALRSLENANLHKDGRVVMLETSGVPIFAKDGSWKGYRGIDRDVTERKHAEAERQRLEQQLLQSQKIESVGRLAGGMAHDINNMLMPILGYAELLEQKLPPHGDEREDLAEIVNGARRIGSMTRQLLALARKQTLDMRRLDLNEVVSGFTRLLQMTLRENIAITVRLAPVAAPVLADRNQLEQVIMNLAVNAQDAMPAGGSFTVSTRDIVADADHAAQRPGMAAGHYLQLIVADTGAGMDRETMRQIFDPFFTTKEAGKGTGLGLAMVYGIVKQHGGYIEVMSEPGSGTTFIISFPVIEGTDDTEADQQRTEASGRGTETVLLVEDQEQVLRLVSVMLSRSGYQVIAASSGREAVEKARAAAGIDLILTDVIMPDMNGKELYERLRELRGDMKVLYISGYPADIISPHGVLESGVNFLRKPFSNQDLLAKVREVLDSHAAKG